MVWMPASVGELMRTMLVNVPLTVVGMVEVKPTLPDVEVTVCNLLALVGTATTIMLVAVPSIVVGTIVVKATLPEVTVVT